MAIIIPCAAHARKHREKLLRPRRGTSPLKKKAARRVRMRAKAKGVCAEKPRAGDSDAAASAQKRAAPSCVEIAEAPGLIGDPHEPAKADEREEREEGEFRSRRNGKARFLLHHIAEILAIGVPEDACADIEDRQAPPPPFLPRSGTR